ncbi:unnamed protein product [Mytilus edulis]|uniref:Ig-like domain-containing protein n=1 Tax=Mytilus edulis TaxID=6550 RepID=A0A8S3Q397_MYTED|nr:unnamed protein product [Mytilus edulis]
MCTTDAGRPSARIQWYLSSLNITDLSTPQQDICNADCNGKVISSSVLVYIGNIIDTGKTIHCTANNLDGEVVKSQDRYIDILFPVSKVTLTATQSDENPIKIVSGSQQRFICTTDASRPAARIQWYLSGTNITDEASAQPSICSAGCETVISSSVLSYIGNITDIGKIIYCTAANVEGQSVNSTMRSVDILCSCNKNINDVNLNYYFRLFSVPITKVNLTATPTDENPIKVISGSYQRFICTTDAGRPSARIQWYMSGTNVTDEASPQPSSCSAGCETVMSSSVLSYIGNITDNGRTIYCSAVNVEGQSVNSTMKSIDILCRNDSDSYTCHAKNILTPSGMSPQERTSQQMFDVNVQCEY